MDTLQKALYANNADNVSRQERDTAAEHLNLFKNSLIYTLTYTIVNDYISSGRGSVFTLALCVAISVAICHFISIQWNVSLQVIKEQRQNGTPHYALPVYCLINESLSTAKNLLIQLEATLLARYAQMILADAQSDMWVFVLSIIGIALWWILTVSLGTSRSGVDLL